jgi:hypothetical protein
MRSLFNLTLAFSSSLSHSARSSAVSRGGGHRSRRSVLWRIWQNWYPSVFFFAQKKSSSFVLRYEVCSSVNGGRWSQIGVSVGLRRGMAEGEEDAWERHVTITCARLPPRASPPRLLHPLSPCHSFTVLFACSCGKPLIFRFCFMLTCTAVSCRCRLSLLPPVPSQRELVLPTRTALA